MWVKICANTSLEDAQLAVAAGADALGFIFAPSKRRVTAVQVAAIIPHLPAGIEKIGVLQPQVQDPARTVQEISELVKNTGLTGIQLHGGLDLPLLRALSDAFAGKVKIIQVLHWELGLDFANAGVLEAQFQQIAAKSAITDVLVDTKVGAASGGTGRAFDWHEASASFAAAPVGLRLIVAGGLQPENVAEAVDALKPWGVDVASGVEAAPGRKDPVRLRRFLENARRAT